jgi:hypothetical protein
MKTARDIFMFALGAVIMISFFTIVSILIFKEIPKGNSELLYLLLGADIGFAGSVVQYFFGSSAGSAAKSEILTKTKNDVPTT